jgi:hypothetical protein
MQWFKHDSDASNDAKIKKLIIKHGAVGYAVYFHCLELIVSNISETNVTFELEHDSEIIADDLKIQGNGSQSGSQIVEQIMRTIIDLHLFDENNGHIFCFKLLKRLDTSMTSNKKMRELITSAKENHDTVMMNHDTIMQEEKRIEEIRTDKNILPSYDELFTDDSIPEKSKEIRHKHGEYNHVLLTESEYNNLLTDWGKEKLDHMITELDEGIETKGYKYKNFSLALRKWEKNDFKTSGKKPAYNNHELSKAQEEYLL